MNKTRLVRVSNRASFDPTRVVSVNFAGQTPSGKPCVSIFFSDDLRYQTFTGKEMEAFRRWHDDHSIGDYLHGKLKRE